MHGDGRATEGGAHQNATLNCWEHIVRKGSVTRSRTRCVHVHACVCVCVQVSLDVSSPVDLCATGLFSHCLVVTKVSGPFESPVLMAFNVCVRFPR